MRAVLNGDAAAYDGALGTLQPGVGEHGKMLLSIYLCKAALHLQVVKHHGAKTNGASDPLDGITEDYRSRSLRPHSISINWGPQFAERFTVEEGGCAAHTLCDAGREAEGEGGSFRARFPVQPDALLFQRDAGRFRAGRVHRPAGVDLGQGATDAVGPGQIQ